MQGQIFSPTRGSVKATDGGWTGRGAVLHVANVRPAISTKHLYTSSSDEEGVRQWLDGDSFNRGCQSRFTIEVHYVDPTG